MSVILDFVNQVDLVKSARGVMQRVIDELKREETEPSYLEKMLDMKTNRLACLIANKGNDITREEVRQLCLATATGLDTVFGLPVFKDDDTIHREFEILQQQTDGRPKEIFFCGPGEPVTSLDVMRSFLYLTTLRMCLNRYPAGSNTGSA